MKKTVAVQRAVAIALLLCSLVLCLASCAQFSEEDQKTAEAKALFEAEEYYSDHFYGRTLSGVSYSRCSTSIEKSEFSGGRYVVTVKIVARVSYGGYSISRHLMDVRYSIAVEDGFAIVKDTEYITT